MAYRVGRTASGALVLAVIWGMIGAPASAQIRDQTARTGDPVFVLGTTTSRLCFERARALDASDDALAVCDDAVARPDTTQRERAGDHVNRGIVLAARGDHEAALEDFEQAANTVPDLAEAHINAGRSLLALERWAETEAALTRAIALADEEAASGENADDVGLLARLHFDRAIAREESGDLAGAFGDYSRAADLAPDWEEPRRELGRFRVVNDEAEQGA